MYMCIYTHISDDITSTFHIQFLHLIPQNSNNPITFRRLGYIGSFLIMKHHIYLWHILIVEMLNGKQCYNSH